MATYRCSDLTQAFKEAFGPAFEAHYADFTGPILTPKNCTCGAEHVKSNMHSDWCDKND